MARYNEILSGRFNRALQKLTGIKGEPPSPQLAGEIVPVHIIESGPENRYPEGWNRYGIILTLGGTVGNFNFHEFRNPTGSGVVAVFEHTTVRSAASGAGFNFRVGKQTTDGSSLNTNIARLDGRSLTGGSSLSVSTGVGLATTALIFFVINNDVAAHDYPLILTVNQEITVLPGDAFMIDCQSTNASTATSHIWRERPLEDSEKI